MIRYIKTFEVIFSTNNLSGMHISTIWHSLNVLKYFCPLSVSQQEIVEMLRKLVPRLINTYKIPILNQNSYILGKFVVLRCQIYN